MASEIELNETEAERERRKESTDHVKEYLEWLSEHPELIDDFEITCNAIDKAMRPLSREDLDVMVTF